MRTSFNSAVTTGLAALMLGAVAIATPASAAEEVFVIPAPKTDLPPSDGLKTAIIAGGCFWGVQGVYQHTKGVTQAVSGYSGGQASTAKYEMIGRGTTGHAEAVKITYDPKVVTYGKLLEIFFSVVHDPTQLNRQGPDTGTQYRSTIFPASADEKKVAEDYVAQLNATGVYKAKIATTIEPLQAFYPAEDYHQDYMVRNPNQPYIFFNDRPKLQNFKKVFADSYKDKPSLVRDATASN